MSYRKNYKRTVKFIINNQMNNEDVKNRLMDFLYDNLDLYKFNFKVLEQDSDIKYIKSDQLVSPNYNGSNCLMIFTRMENKYYSFMIDRKSLSFSREQINMENIKIIPVSVRLNKDIYNGSIFDGIILSNSESENIFMINDIYMFRGEKNIDSDLKYKIIHLNAYLDRYYIKDNAMNNITLQVNKYYSLNNISKVIDMISNNIKGMAFYPKQSGTKYIFLYSNGVKKTVPDAPTHMPKIETTNLFINIRDKSKAVFEIQKTDKTDVYKLFLLQKTDKKKLKVKKIGLAYIPTKKCSILCNKILENKDKTLVSCEYNKDKAKWIPIDTPVTMKRPNLISEVLKLQ